MHFKGHFDGAVCGMLGSVDFGNMKGEGFVEFFSQWFGEVGHFLEASGTFLPQPLINLFGPEGGFAHGFERFRDLRNLKIANVFALAHGFCGYFLR